MKIRNVNGTYWNAENNCFTQAECAATEYETEFDLPGVVECDDTTRCEVMSHGGGDIRYYPNDDLDANAVAKVVGYKYTQQDQDNDLERINEILNVDIP